MPVDIACSCGRRYRVGDEALGKSVRCKGCQKPIKVRLPELGAEHLVSAAPDPFANHAGLAGGSPLLAPPPAGGPWSWARLKKPVLIAGAVGCAGISLLVVGMMLGRLLHSAGGYNLDPDLAAKLGPEVAALDYGIRPPQGFTAIPSSGFDHRGKSQEWTWSKPDAELRLSIRQEPQFRGNSAIQVISTGDVINTTPGLQIYAIPHASVDHGKIGSLSFTRIRCDRRQQEFYYGPGSTHRHLCAYAAYDDDRYIEIVGSCEQSLDSPELALLEAAARSFHKREAGSNSAAPPALPPQQPNASPRAQPQAAPAPTGATRPQPSRDFAQGNTGAGQPARNSLAADDAAAGNILGRYALLIPGDLHYRPPSGPPTGFNLEVVHRWARSNDRPGETALTLEIERHPSYAKLQQVPVRTSSAPPNIRATRMRINGVFIFPGARIEPTTLGGLPAQLVRMEHSLQSPQRTVYRLCFLALDGDRLIHLETACDSPPGSLAYQQIEATARTFHIAH